MLENNGNVKTNCRHTMNTHTQTRNINAKPCQKQPDKAAIHIHIIFSSVNRFWKATESIRKHCNSMKHHKKTPNSRPMLSGSNTNKNQKTTESHWRPLETIESNENYEKYLSMTTAGTRKLWNNNKNLSRQVLENNGNVKNQLQAHHEHKQTRHTNAKPCQKQEDKAEIHIHIIFSTINRFWKATQSIRKHCKSIKLHKNTKLKTKAI